MGSRSLSPAESHYTISELECLALMCAIRDFGPYLIHRPFTVYTDHIALKWLQSFKLSNNNRLVRWALQLQPYRFTIHYKPGKQMGTVDALSRMEHMVGTPTRRTIDAVAACDTLPAAYAARVTQHLE